MGFSMVRGWELVGVLPSRSRFAEPKCPLLSALYVKEIYVFALSEKVTRISLSSNLYWSMIGPVLVTRRTSIGQRAKQYCLLLATSSGPIIDQYWSHHPLLRVRCEAYVYEGIVRDALRG